jgi:hypothetical protein
MQVIERSLEHTEYMAGKEPEAHAAGARWVCSRLAR